MVRPPHERPTLAQLAEGSGRGIKCVQCGASADWQVYYTRLIMGGIRRVRICRQCGHKSVTIERPIG